MAVYFSPVFNDQTVDSAGNPLVGGYVNVFLAGTSTPVTTYTDNTGGTPQPTNIVLDAAGRPANPIWITGGIPVKFRLFSAAAAALLTIDNVSGINDPAGITAQDQWVLYGAAPTRISNTSFSVVGDQTAIFQVGRRLKSTNSGGTIYSSITASVFGAVTTVTVVNDSGVLDSGMSAVSYGLISATNTSAPTTLARAGANTDITSLASVATVSGTPNFTGNATGQTQAGTDNSTRLATTAQVVSSMQNSRGLIVLSGSVGNGYGAGVGGTVTQLTSKTTAVTLNTLTGSIVMFSSAGSASPQVFQLNNTSFGTNDTVILTMKGNTNSYLYFPTNCSAGVIQILFYTTGGTAVDAPTINFSIIKGAVS